MFKQNSAETSPRSTQLICGWFGKSPKSSRGGVSMCEGERWIHRSTHLLAQPLWPESTTGPSPLSNFTLNRWLASVYMCRVIVLLTENDRPTSCLGVVVVDNSTACWSSARSNTSHSSSYRQPDSTYRINRDKVRPVISGQVIRKRLEGSSQLIKIFFNSILTVISRVWNIFNSLNSKSM